MGCVSSKQACLKSPGLGSPVALGDKTLEILDSSRHIYGGVWPSEKIREEPKRERVDSLKRHHSHSGNSNVLKKVASAKRAAFSFRFGRLTEAEHVAAGWPAWLSALAGEAIEGWLPLRSDAFAKLEKIGQGTYSNVYRARDLQTGKMVALKKVRFDNFRPESVRFMAREIIILRRLGHPNVMKLEGIITSRLSCNLYLVFEYMEHDLSGLLSCPDIKFTETQIKCYMRQLLCGLEHCHSRGVMHRDIKTSNILVNNKGILKIADFGLANFLNGRRKQQLTSRVVTLWYRPPELFLGSTNYGLTVDLWSVGCVFAELFTGKPLLKGRTEVEQLHKIFKLCGSPPDEYWKHSKLPLATMFKPQYPYESELRERCKKLPRDAVDLIASFLSIEPHKRGCASAALESEYFTAKPHACDPSSLPRYSPNKEMDARFREEALRKRVDGPARTSGATRKPRRVCRSIQESNNFHKMVPTEEVDSNIQVARRNNRASNHIHRGKGTTSSRMPLKQSDVASEASQTTEKSQRDSTYLVPINNDAATRSYSHNTSRCQRLHASNPPLLLQADCFLDLQAQECDDFSRRGHIDVRGSDAVAIQALKKSRTQSQRQKSFDITYAYVPVELLMELGVQEGTVIKSGPLLSQIHRVNPRQVGHIHHHMACRSRFSKDLQLKN